jgi:hypothetical protein
MWQRKYLVIFSVLVFLISDYLIVKYREDETTSLKSVRDSNDSFREHQEEFENSYPQVKVQCSTLTCDLMKIDENWVILKVNEDFLRQSVMRVFNCRMEIFELVTDFIRTAASASAKRSTKQITRFMFARTTVKLG